MSADSRHFRSLTARGKAVGVAVAAVLAMGLGSGATVRAQDATPAASPTAAECDAPGLDMTTAATPFASPEAEPSGAEAASPVAETTPEPEDEGTPAEGADADEIIAAVQNIIACVNSGDAEGAVSLMTDNFIQSEFGATSQAEAVQALQGFSFGDVTVTNPRTYDDGSVSADVAFMETKYHLAGWTLHMLQEDGYWKIDDQGLFTPEFEGDAAVVGVNLGETTADDGTTTYTIEPNAPTVAQSEVLVLHGINAGQVDHEIVVLRLPEGADPKGLLDGSISESDVEFIGQISLAPGEEGDMVLEGLEPGVYTLACFFPTEDGSPHAAHGMIAQIEVQPAS